jgi:hypothetical protein
VPGIKAHPAISIRDTQLKAMAALGEKLRLPLSSRIRSESASTRPGRLVDLGGMDDLIPRLPNDARWMLE